jgi:hypothetical protein
MLYRLAMVVVALFWGAMWTLLIRSELHPQETRLRAIPAEIVLRQVFLQAQPSDLTIKSGGARNGHVRISPKTDEQTGAHALDFLGNVQVDLPGSPGQRAYWDGSLQMSRDFDLVHLRGNFSLRPAGVRASPISTLQVEVDPARNEGRYRLTFGDDDPIEENFTLDQAGLNSLLDRWGIDRQFRQMLSPTGIKVTPEITARLARLNVRNGEQAETYLLTVKNQGQTLLELHISQLGQILQAKTLLGWELAPD